MTHIDRISFVNFAPKWDFYNDPSWTVYVAEIRAKPANDRDSYYIGILDGVRRAKGYRETVPYTSGDISYAGIPFIGFQANLSQVGLERPIFSPIVNSYLAFYQTPSEAKEKLRLTILATLNELLEGGEYEWLENAINLKYDMENL